MGLVEKTTSAIRWPPSRRASTSWSCARPAGLQHAPEVLTEIDQLKTSTARLRDALDEPLPAATVAALSPDDRYQGTSPGRCAWRRRFIICDASRVHGQRKILGP